MEIVIKIKDKLLKDLNNEGLNPCMVIGKFDMHIADAIKNGTVLPKGHGRLLDAKDLLVSLEKDTREAFTKHQVWLMFSEYNEDVPTVVEADMEHSYENT